MGNEASRCGLFFSPCVDRVRACVHVYTWVRIRIFMHHMTERESHEFSMCHIPAQGKTFLKHVNAKK